MSNNWVSDAARWVILPIVILTVIVTAVITSFVTTLYIRFTDGAVPRQYPAPPSSLSEMPPIPVPPPVARTTPEDNRDWGTKALEGLGGLFAGQCLGKRQTIDLSPTEWREINPNDCRVTSYIGPGQVVIGRDFNGEFRLDEERDRIPIAVRGNIKGWRYSLCPDRGPVVPLNWDCTPLPTTARH